MHLSQEDLKQLLRKINDKTISRQELRLLQLYLHSDNAKDMLDQVDFSDLHEAEESLFQPAENRYQRIVSQINLPRKVVRFPPIWVAAASVLFLLSGMYLFYYVYYSTRPQPEEEAQVVRTLTTAPSDRAVLQLSDGRQINLDDSTNGTVIADGAANIHISGNQLVYDKKQGGSSTGNNIILTPKGKQIRIVLPDGSRAWINTASKLVYPVSFSGPAREVEVSGEVYFEVSQDKQHPFVVNTVQLTTEVLGTQFNVSAYPDDTFTQTTLVQGSVKVGSRKESTDKKVNYSILKPGQQATLYNNGVEIELGSVDAEEVVSWKDNLFVFHNEKVQDVMKKISRWYNVEVEYLDGMEGQRIGGTIPRFKELKDIMQALVSTKLLKYKEEGGKIIIMK
ncbi:MAG: FecR domain-containing protein [Candidatus Pseudobacter hemicellulosilyticus]|uniref:FecR domain-containing protein n=1 Tax=Candidatus Pseudobacter hemicellulosilyticus TaxID=3121375 RepID=A0AAJ5WR90_9BACT|nr:MAG: FecR domain-containing protein [Pseudobacter sp.]